MPKPMLAHNVPTSTSRIACYGKEQLTSGAVAAVVLAASHQEDGWDYNEAEDGAAMGFAHACSVVWAYCPSW